MQNERLHSKTALLLYSGHAEFEKGCGKCVSEAGRR
jgi:hypothetical protein